MLIDDQGDQLITWWTIFRTCEAINQRLAQAIQEEDGVSIRCYYVLVCLYNGPERGMRMQDLSAHTATNKSAMTRLIDRMEADGLVSRHIYASNRREVCVLLTEQGVHQVQRLIPRHQERLTRYFFQYLSEEEQRIVRQVFARMARQYTPPWE